MDDWPSEEEENQYHHHHRPGSENRPSEGFVDADIENGFKVLLSHLLNILSDSVKNDNGIIDGEPDDGQNNSQNI